MKRLCIAGLVAILFLTLAISFSSGLGTDSWSVSFGTSSVKNWKLVWDANTEADLAGYNVYWATTSGGYSQINSKDVGNVTECPLSSLNLPDGTWYFVVTAYDTSGNESGFSNEVSHDLDMMSPDAPAGLRIEEE